MVYRWKVLGGDWNAAERLALAASRWDADDAWELDSAEALKTAKKRGESHVSSARCVGRIAVRNIYVFPQC
jgi:hypothetical protein